MKSRVQNTRTIAFLGPEGTFSHYAVMQYFPKYPSRACRDLKTVFDAVKKRKVRFGLVPYENSQTGLIQSSFDYLLKSGLRVIARYDVPIEHCLLSKVSPRAVQVVYSHPQAIAQCRQWIEKHLPQAEIRVVESSARLAQRISDEPESALIGSQSAARIYGLPVQASGIQDSQQNMTRFWLLGRASDFRPSHEDDSITAYFVVAHRPGALVRVLQQFQYHAINLTHLHSLPVSGTPWHYGFFANLACSASDPHFHEMEKLVRPLVSEWKILGSYRSVGSPEAVRQRWWAVDRLSNQFQPNKKILYFYLKVKHFTAPHPLRQQLAELRLLSAVSIGKVKWKEAKQIRDRARERTVMERVRKSGASRLEIAWYTRLVFQSREVQRRLQEALEKGSVPAEEIVELPLRDLRYYIDQIDQWILNAWRD